MKKLFILLIAFALTAMSAKVFAQSTGTNPAPGATHNYFISDNGNTVQWSVTKGDLTTSTTEATINAANAASTDISWSPTVTVGDWYYVHVVETDGNGCSNEKVLPVQITSSPFFLSIAAAAETQCYNGAVQASIDANDPSVINYDHGNATLEFTVSPAGLNSSYSGYKFDVDIDFGSYSGLSETVSVSSNASISNGTVTVSDNNPVTITYVVDNQNTFTNITDADGDAADYTATATISNGEAANGVSDNGTGPDTDDTSIARPNTSGIGTN